MPATGIPLPRLPEHLARACAAGQRIPGYVRFWQLAHAGRLPGVRLEYGRWFFDEESVPAIAAALGLKLKPALARKLLKRLPDPTMAPGDPARFVAQRGDITMGGRTRIKSGKLPPVKPVRAHP